MMSVLDQLTAERDEVCDNMKNLAQDCSLLK